MPSYKPFATAIAFSLTVAFTAPAHALLLDQGVTTLDTATNLEWLDLTESTNRSFDDLAGQFGTGGDFAGWRHANTAEVSALFTSQGYPPGYDSSPTTVAMFQLIQMLGETAVIPSGSDVQSAAFGLYDDSATGTLPRAGIAVLEQLYFNNGNPGFERSHVVDDNVLTDIGLPIYGHWLVRSAATTEIPAPGAMAIFAIGLAGLAATRRRRS
ncbi:MAG: MYXO-CTERM domain-containing protein [Paracoccaceae bacterium]|jgi:MYXO-CTERM domain-containing protein